MSQEPFSSSPTVVLSAADEEKAALEKPTSAELSDAVDSAEPPAEAAPPAPSAPTPNERLTASVLVPIERLSADDQYRIRPPEQLGDVSQLATDIARLGQLVPVDLVTQDGNVYQVITGFRRIEALKFLHREHVVARVFHSLDADEAMLIALAHAIHAAPATLKTLREWRERLEAQGKLTPSVRDMLEKALNANEQLSPEQVEDESDEVDADELVSDVTLRLSQCNQDLALLADEEVYSGLDAKRRGELLKQLRYSIDLVNYFEKLGLS
jgi:ParB family transcriptional regulator, chromosome partitioning protein